MNADGGTLYIGVKDDGSIRGIQGDYCHLNDGEKDEYAGQYSENKDGYELKIRNSVSQYLSSMAGALFTFDIEEYEKNIVAKIIVSKSVVPIYYNGNFIYQRQGNRTKVLKDNALTHFCATKWFGSSTTSVVTEPDSVIISTKSTVCKTAKRKDVGQVKSDNDIRDYSLWHTLNLHKNGEWSFDRKAQSRYGEVICSCNIEKYRKSEKHLLLTTYSSGNINAVEIKNSARWIAQQGYGVNGYDLQQGLLGLFCVNPMDMVAIFYEKEDKSYAKIVDVSQIGTHQALNSQGNEVVEEGAKDVRIFHIHHKYHDALRGLTRSSRKYKGYDIDNDAKARSTIQKLKEIVSEEYGVIFE